MNEWFEQRARQASAAHRQSALGRQNQLTKPPGSLGVLEHCAVRLAALQRSDSPSAERVAIRVFAADHGVAAEGVSAFPQAVTAEMVKNFSAGGAAITVLAHAIGADFQVVNVGTVTALPPLDGVIDRRIAAGTANLRVAPAMTAEQVALALAAGRDSIDALAPIDIFIGGEMGIANTTSASALACALLQRSADTFVGRGTGLDDVGVTHKTLVIAAALQRHAAHINTPLGALQCVGGFEIAALAGAYVRCAQRGIAVLVDGFICTAAALVAIELNPSIREWLLFSHCSAERGHRQLIEHLDARPLLDLDLRLGEGSGAAVAVPLLRMACALHNGMASFASAGVSHG